MKINSRIAELHTDCLGHVALVSELMRKLGQTKPKSKSTVVAVFIANEENYAITGVGVDALVKDGLLNKLKEGPLGAWKCRKRRPSMTASSIPGLSNQQFCIFR
ncbi:Peptidase M20 [Sesbania bispinosa]|nr:Peptidase M20 [Sesbania bispinosa]